MQSGGRALWKFNDSMLKDHGFPSIHNENDHLTTSGSNVEKKPSSLDLFLGLCIVFNLSFNYLFDAFLAFSCFQHQDVFLDF